jgi:two-component SAPR family response regulator
VRVVVDDGKNISVINIIYCFFQKCKQKTTKMFTCLHMVSKTLQGATSEKNFIYKNQEY